ncbi:nucleotidyltransferase domain-containing protein [Leifsonia poae]|uniref:nucleotidyltransferase domain-containing protein n=1 Tax=Leifsonia poae TaxID=110933 RepID=UPI001CBD873B|nr:nucleotidyltransferase domain-containing protein [Leifsonia poae]
MKHHDEAVARYVQRESAATDCLAIIVSGSLARGAERPESDVDLYLVVTEERWADAHRHNRLMYTEDDGIGYPGGYYDVKLATLSYLDDAADRGDDPVRESFASTRIAFSRIDDLPDRIARIHTTSDTDWEARAASFLAQARLHGGYFLDQAWTAGDQLLLTHASVHLATSACRALLALNHRRFPGPKYLAKLTAELDRKPDGFDDLISALLSEPNPATGGALLSSLESFTGSVLPHEQTLSTFVLDNELAWRYRTKTPEYS